MTGSGRFATALVSSPPVGATTLSQRRPETMNVSITGARSELGGILARRRAASATESIHIDVVGQQANSLLHDGHAWKDFARTALVGTRRAMRSARTAGGAQPLSPTLGSVAAA